MPQGLPLGTRFTGRRSELCLATVVTNLGGWMQDMGAAWLMTSLTAKMEWLPSIEPDPNAYRLEMTKVAT